MGNFCKKRRPQLHLISMIETEKLQNSIKKYCFQQSFPARKMARASQRSRTNQKPLYLVVFLILEMKNVHISCSKPTDRVPPCFDRTFLNISSTWIPNTLQNCKIRSFRKVMIKTSFQLFLLIKTIEKIAIFDKSFLGPINKFLSFFFGKRENTP